MSKAHKVITRFSEDVDLPYDIRALAPELVRSQEQKWFDEIRRELLPAWIRNQAHPVIQAGLERLENVSSRITEDCVFIDYDLAPASGYALPTVKLEFGCAVQWGAKYDHSRSLRYGGADIPGRVSKR